MFVILTAFSEMRSCTEQPAILKVLWARSRKDLFSSHSNLRRRFILPCRYLSHKTPEVIHEDDQFLSNIYIWKGAYWGPNQAPFSQPRGDEMQREVGSLKEAFNIYIPPNNPPENMARRQKGVNSMHHRMRCYHVTRKSAMFVFRKRLKSLCVI